MKRRALITFSTLALLCASSGAARADDERGAAEAMRRGVAAYAQGDAAGALTAYDEAKRLAPRANVPYLYAAEALIHVERYAEAVTNLEQYLAKNPNVSDAADVKERIARLRREHFPGRLRVEANVEGARIAVDGSAREEALPVVMTLPPGKHAIVWTHDGYESATQEIVVAGDAETLAVGSLSRSALPPPTTIASPLTRAVPSASSNEDATTPNLRTVGWVVGGTGLATLATAFVLDLTVLKSKVDAFNDAAKNQGANHGADLPGLQSDARGWQTGVLTTYIAGGVLIAGGAAIVLLSPRGDATSKSSASASTSMRLAPLLGQGGGGAQVVGRF